MFMESTIIAIALIAITFMYYIDPFDLISPKLKKYLLIMPKGNSFSARSNRFIAVLIHIILIGLLYFFLMIGAGVDFAPQIHVAVIMFELIWWPTKYILIGILRLKHPDVFVLDKKEKIEYNNESNDKILSDEPSPDIPKKRIIRRRLNHL